MKNQHYFLQKIKIKKLKCRLLQFLFDTLRHCIFLILELIYKNGLHSSTKDILPFTV